MSGHKPFSKLVAKMSPEAQEKIKCDPYFTNAHIFHLPSPAEVEFGPRTRVVTKNALLAAPYEYEAE